MLPPGHLPQGQSDPDLLVQQHLVDLPRRRYGMPQILNSLNFRQILKKCVRNDSFYTSAQRNKIIRESCTALYGYCRENERPVTSGDKHILAKLICGCAPNSLGDSSNSEEPEVIVHNYMDITIYD